MESFNSINTRDWVRIIPTIIVTILEEIFIKIPMILVSIIISPILYTLKVKGKVWNRFQDLPYKLRTPLNWFFGNDEDGIYFDPRVLNKTKLANNKLIRFIKEKKRGSFIDFFFWNIIRNPLHNYELLVRGLDLSEVEDVVKRTKIKKNKYIVSIYEAKLYNGTSKRGLSAKIWFRKLGYKLELHLGYRINDVVRSKTLVDMVDKLYVDSDMFNRLTISKFYFFLTSRGYPYIRNAFTLRFKKIKKD